MSKNLWPWITIVRGKPTPGHAYPESYQPGSGDRIMDEIWEGLDMFRPGVIPPDVRDMIAGYWRAHIEKVLTRERAGGDSAC